MKKAIYFLVCLSIFILIMFKYQNSSIKKINNTTEIAIGYGTNSYMALITDQEELHQLEDLFNSAKFDKSDTSIHHPYLIISYHGKNSATSFYIDNKDVIKLGENSYVKSEKINFNNLYAIYHKYLTEKQ